MQMSSTVMVKAPPIKMFVQFSGIGNELFKGLWVYIQRATLFIRDPVREINALDVKFSHNFFMQLHVSRI